MPIFSSTIKRPLGVQLTVVSPGDFKETLYFYQDNSTASQAAVALTCMGDAVRTGYALPVPSSVIGITIVSNAARTAGTLTVDATIAGSATGLQAVLNGTNTTVHYANQDDDRDQVAAGELIGVKVTTDAGWLPETADIIVAVTVGY